MLTRRIGDAEAGSKRIGKDAARLLTAICCLLAAALALCAADSAEAEGSRMIGLLITTRDISLSADEDGVLRAVEVRETPASDPEYIFENVDGLRFICFADRDQNGERSVITNVDAGIADADFNFENESSVTMDGTIYYAPRRDETSFFYNPVLRTEDGRVYAVPGDPMVVSADLNPPGSSVGQTLRDERKHMEYGGEITDVTVANLEIMAVLEPLKITLLQFSEAHELLKAEECAPDAVPKEIVPLAEADYLLLETRGRAADGGVFNRREVFGREDDCLNTLSCRKDGICIQQYHEVIWSK